MRDQYAGDLSDLLKLALLRALASDDGTLGVGWYYNPANDKRPDGRHREYCNEPKWKSLDLPLWEALRALPDRSVGALERMPIWPPCTSFYRIPVPTSGGRFSWAFNMKNALEKVRIVFLDPDNGVGKVSKRHATIEEIGMMREPGRAVVVIKFPAREDHDKQLIDYHRLMHDRTGTSSILTVCTTVRLPQPRVRWFTIIDADYILKKRVRCFTDKLRLVENIKCRAHEGN